MLNASRMALTMIVVAGGVSALAFAQPATKEAPAKPTEKAQPEKAQPEKAKEPAVKEKPKYEGFDGKTYEVQKSSEIKIVVEDLVLGDGAEATAESVITINYHGTLAKDGKVFDSTKGKEPATFPLQRLIPGWQAGIPGMKIGGLRRLTIPYQFAYGEQGAGDVIPAKADLVFLIELKGLK